MQVKDLITSRVCGNTVFENSWIWYCDECRKHGTATSAHEAEYMASCHDTYFSYEKVDWEEMGEDFEPLMYGDVSPEERASRVWEGLCISEGAMYIIDEGNNITYSFGDDYDNKTPNQVTDIDKMIDMQKQLGLE